MIRRNKNKNKRIVQLAFAALLLLEDTKFPSENLPLCFAVFQHDLQEMEDELFTDPHYFAMRAQEAQAKNDWTTAERFSFLEREGFSEHWDPYVRLGQIYFQQAKHAEATANITKALELIYKSWREDQEYLDFETVEGIEQIADLILARDRSEYLKRLNQYAYGLLYFCGTASIDTVIKEIKALGCFSADFQFNEFLSSVVDCGMIKIKGDVLYHPDVQDPSVILEELSRRGIAQKNHFSLSVLKLAEEKRIQEFFFDIEESMEDLDDDLLDFTDGEFGLVEIYEELRKDVTGRRHHDLLLDRFIQERNPHIKDLLEAITLIWNHFPRWELSGRSPSQMDQKRTREGKLPEWDLNVTKFKVPADNLPPTLPKIGRNDLCKCGSGIKYKKCCGR